MLEFISNKLLVEKKISSPLVKSSNVSGGCINDCYKVSSHNTSYFVKVNSLSKFPEMFLKEAKGLSLLRSSKTLAIPKEILQFDFQNQSFLVLEWVDEGSREKDFWFKFGEELANLHRQTNEDFGLDHHNYIGSLVQYNDYKQDWHTFFLENRLISQLELGISNGWASTSLFKYAEKITQVIEQEFPKESPALLHGDLWSGNFIVGSKNVFLIDPAIYFGNREMEIAFSKLFGGFDNLFYEGYNESFPLKADFNKRLEIYQLYPLLVHANLFGSNYIDQCLSILRKF